MAVPGKKAYMIYLTEEYVDVVRATLMKGNYKGGLSGYFDDILKGSYETIKASGIRPQGQVTPAKLLRLFVGGMMKQMS